VLLCVVCVVAVVQGCIELPQMMKRDVCPPWSYNGTDNGPSQWGSLCSDYSLCSSGQEQSPINVLSTDLVYLNETLSSLLVPRYEEQHSISFTNTGHYVEVLNTDIANTLTLPDGSVYTLTQFHFHDQSEHSIDGVSFPMEMHLVHQNASGNYAVLAFFFEVGSSSELLSELTATLSNIQEPTNITVVPFIELQNLITQPFEFIYYQGSLTTPPCSEIVKWFISKTVLTGTSSQISQITKLMGINHRPQQSLNSRVLTQYKLPATTSSSIQLTIAYVLLIGSLILFVIF